MGFTVTLPCVHTYVYNVTYVYYMCCAMLCSSKVLSSCPSHAATPLFLITPLSTHVLFCFLF